MKVHIQAKESATPMLTLPRMSFMCLYRATRPWEGRVLHSTVKEGGGQMQILKKSGLSVPRVSSSCFLLVWRGSFCPFSDDESYILHTSKSEDCFIRRSRLTTPFHLLP